MNENGYFTMINITCSLYSKGVIWLFIFNSVYV